MCTYTRQARPILIIGTKHDGIYVTYDGKETPLADFMMNLDEEEKKEVRTALETALNSCVIQKQGDDENPRTDFLYIFYGTIHERQTRNKNVEPQVKLFVKYPGGHHIFVTPSQYKGKVNRVLDDLKPYIELLVGPAPLDKPGHRMGEDTENRLGFRT